MVVHISLQFHHYDIILNFILRFFFKLTSIFLNEFYSSGPFGFRTVVSLSFIIFPVLLLMYSFSLVPFQIQHVPHLMYKGGFLCHFTRWGKEKAQTAWAQAQLRFHHFIKFSSVHRNIRRWVNTPSHSVAIGNGQPCRHIGWGQRKKTIPYLISRSHLKNLRLTPAQELFKNWEITKC